MNSKLELAHPPPRAGRADTSLRYTDILFGFVIRELFLRLQNWSKLGSEVRWHLLVGTALVLGSWIGFRRSANRTEYEVKFFNLPLFRFLVDQAMLILYFRIAILTDVEGKKPPPADLATATVDLIAYVFALYALWDLLGIWMAETRGNAGLRYPRLEDGKMTSAKQPANWLGFGITVLTLAFLIMLRLTACRLVPYGVLIITTVLLLGYRVAKEVRTSWQQLS